MDVRTAMLVLIVLSPAAIHGYHVGGVIGAMLVLVGIFMLQLLVSGIACELCKRCPIVANCLYWLGLPSLLLLAFLLPMETRRVAVIAASAFVPALLIIALPFILFCKLIER